MRFLEASLLGVALLITPLAASSSALTEEELAAIGARVFAEFAPVGLAIAVVQDAELTFSGGYGVRELGKAAKVDADTLLPIASLTKAFTAAALAILVDEERLDWDDRVIDHLPGFRMADPWVTREFTIRDLLTHRSGLPLGAGDLLLFGGTTRSEVVHALRYLEPESSFRTEYAYDNLLYIVAGEVIGAVSGTPWEDFVESHLFAPLGMRDCRALTSRVADAENRATQHGRIQGTGTATPIEDDPDEPTSAAGTIMCSVNSMSKWARLFLDDGLAADGERIISEEQIRELLTPMTLMPTRGYMRRNAGAHFSAYALGWNVSDFHGYFLAAHSGAGTGTTAYIALVPELGAAIVALSNDVTYSTMVTSMQTIDSIVRQQPHDWIGEMAAAVARMRELAPEEPMESTASESVSTPPALEDLAAVYRDPWYGDVAVELDDGVLRIHMTRSDVFVGELIRLGDLRFVAKWRDRNLNADAYVVFELDGDGSLSGMKMSAVSPDADFSFDFHDLDLARVADGAP